MNKTRWEPGASIAVLASTLALAGCTRESASAPPDEQPFESELSAEMTPSEPIAEARPAVAKVIAVQVMKLLATSRAIASGSSLTSNSSRVGKAIRESSRIGVPSCFSGGRRMVK